MPRPDGEPDRVGTLVLDEPAAHQSDRTILEMQLRARSKKQHKDMAVVSMEHPFSGADIQRWIDNINELHRTKPPPNVYYSQPMPDIESLMQVWPDDVEEMLQGGLKLPGGQMEMTLEEYAKTICAILDIPVHASKDESSGLLQSLHLLFTLWSEFKNNQHFRQTFGMAGDAAAMGDTATAASMAGGPGGTAGFGAGMSGGPGLGELKEAS